MVLAQADLGCQATLSRNMALRVVIILRITATQEGNYIGTENIGAIPFGGIILAHSNEQL